MDKRSVIIAGIVLGIVCAGAAVALGENIPGFDNPATNPDFWGRDDAAFLFEKILSDPSTAKQASTADLRRWCEKKEGCRLRFEEGAGIARYTFGRIITREPASITVHVDSGFSPGEVTVFADGKVGFPDGVKVSGKSEISGNIGQDKVYIKGGTVELPPDAGDTVRVYKLYDGASVPVPGSGRMSITTVKNSIPFEIKAESGKRILEGSSAIEVDGKRQGEVFGRMAIAEDGVLLKEASYSKYVRGAGSLKTVSASSFSNLLFGYRISSDGSSGGTYLTFSGCGSHQSCFLLEGNRITATGIPKKSVELYDKSVEAIVIPPTPSTPADYTPADQKATASSDAPATGSSDKGPSMMDDVAENLKSSAKEALDATIAAGNAVIEAGKRLGEIDISSTESVISVFKDVGESIQNKAKSALDATVDLGNVVLAKGNILTSPPVKTDIAAIPPKSDAGAPADSFDNFNKRWYFEMGPSVAASPDQPAASGPLRITITPKAEYRTAGVAKEGNEKEVGTFWLDPLGHLQQFEGRISGATLPNSFSQKPAPEPAKAEPPVGYSAQPELEGSVRPLPGAAAREVVDKVAAVAHSSIGGDVDPRDVVIQSAKTGNTFRLVDEGGVRRWEQVEPVTVNGVRRWMRVDSPKYSIDNHAAFLNKAGGYSNDGNANNCGVRFCIIDGRPKSGDKLGSIPGTGVAAGSTASSKTRQAVTRASSRIR